jgi:energy-coupling factor transporter ATP-binding protein EcfA2
MVMANEIKNWLSSQRAWIQEAARRILANGDISETDIQDLVALVKNIPKKEATVDIQLQSAVHNVTDIKLISIGQIEGIDALNPKKPLEFGDKSLSVVYGKNGSGKSGYVRILNAVCGKSYSKPLKSNVYLAAPQNQQCVIKYSVAGAPKEVSWKVSSEGIEELSSVDIFDSTNGNIYLDGETEASYLPDELVFFTKLVTACNQIADKLKSEQSMLVSALPQILAEYSTTVSAKAYAAIRCDSDINVLCAFSKSDDMKIETLKQSLNTADPLAAARKMRNIKSQIDTMKAEIENCLSFLNAGSISGLQEKYNTVINTRKSATEGAEALKSFSKIDGVSSDTWRKLWLAAREYSTNEAYTGKTFPYIEGDNARCVLCHQELSHEAKQRMQAFEDFIQGKLETEAQQAERDFVTALSKYPASKDVNFIKTACQAAELKEDMSSQICDFWGVANVILDNIQDKKIPAADSISIPDTTDVLKDLLRLSEEAEKSASQFEKDAQTFNREQAKGELLELESKKWISQQKEAIDKEIARLKQVQQYEEWLKQTNTRSISLESDAVSEKLITEAYVTRFNNELKKLGAARIEVELIKSGTTKGHTKHKIRLKNLKIAGEKVSDILSDGEKRIVSVAAFLADVTGRNTNSPFVFDDPISSLDQDFEEQTIERLVELSKTRQVIIFTHRLSFLSIVMSKSGDDLSTVQIYREHWGTGEPSLVPMMGRKTKEDLEILKSHRLSTARKELESKGNAAYYPLAKSICSDFRIILERTVEQVLLNEIVLRYRRDIQTKKMRYLLKINEDDCTLIDEMMTKYSFFEHSQPDESPVDLPAPNELEADIDKVLSWHKEFKKKLDDKH